ncbi:sensor domain-containing phosphodiesterase [Rhodococcus opacus]|uniref:Sensor domain-containing phosphodiesterase n=1 Tax=Rhodococcus opacus TaxID=37919 RepID=A0AAX3YS82_RHOOP|nr:sensor domain-containing phosphodiesterase [Rhodococcus opacus]KXF52957.1 diguanylate cyclase [Rhodococcus sp. SC4]MCZ4586033.1 sensor domain-containing phosphodiesterase [Rhodococcus opacus]NHU48967.1 EAL domain-containing protein [Rhodococcus sp. A14]WLF52018.1 sensor domain-containing phosphodiesterase [Rhodococcus opacus]
MRFDSADPDLWRSVVERATDLVMMSDFVSGRILFLNPAGIRLVGLRDAADARARTTAEFLTDVGLAQTPAVEAALTSDGHWEGISELRHFGTGAPIPVSVSIFTVRAGEAGPAVIAIIARDRRHRRTQDHRFRKALESTAHRAREQHALAELGQLAVDADLDTLLPAAAGAAATLIGVQCASIARLTDTGDALDVVAYRGQPPTPHAFAAGPASQPGYALATGEVVVCPNREQETRFATTTMAGRGLRSGISVPIGDGAPWGVLTVHGARPRDYTDRDVGFLRAVAAVLSAAIGRIDAETRVLHQSLHDPLTGLPNRTAAYRRITAALHTAHRDRTLLALLLVDLDDFKIVNDSLGHAHGDAVLQRLGRRLAGAVRPADTVARLGGDEFVIVCEDIGTADTVTTLAAQITTALRIPDHSTGTSVPLRASIGIAVSDETCTAEELIRRADLAMYRAKTAGAGGHALYHPGEGDSHDADRVLQMSTDLRTALDRDELTLLYQPIVDLRRGAVVAVEALVGWAHPTLGNISRTEFVAVAERTGLIGPVGSWGLRTACRQAAARPAPTGTDVRVHVNVSTVQLRDPVFADQVADILTDTGLPAHRLGLEISETASASVTARTVDTLTALHELGVVLLLDHLGTGHGPLGYLIRYPIFDSLKIDRSYITALPGPRPEAVVTAFVTIARAYGATVIGNGVETRTQLDTLHACGCDQAQGSYLAAPAPADTVPALQRDHRAGADGPSSAPPPAH